MARTSASPTRRSRRPAIAFRYPRLSRAPSTQCGRQELGGRRARRAARSKVMIEAACSACYHGVKVIRFDGRRRDCGSRLAGKAAVQCIARQRRSLVAARRALPCGLVALACGAAEAEPRAKDLFGAEKLPAAASRAVLRLLFQGLLCRRRGHRHGRADLAGDAPVAQPPLGSSGDDPADRETVARRRRRWLAGPAARRHLAAARRADADRPRLAPDRARRRHLAHADAGPPAFGRRARER